MRLLLIRHGESSANAEGRIQGHLDIPLSDAGRRQSQALAERIAALSIDALYTSPLQRATQTADPLAAKLALSPQQRDGLMERDVGALEGLTRKDILERFPEYVRARTAGRPFDLPGYESDVIFNKRVELVTSEIIQAHPGETVAAITHGGVIAAMCRRTLQMPTVRPGPFAIDNCSITVFDVRDGDTGGAPVRPRVQLLSLNDTCHLDGLGNERPA